MNNEAWRPGRIKFNFNKNKNNIYPTSMNLNYWGPLTSQVEELDQTPQINNKIIHEKDKEIKWKLPKHTLSKVRRKWNGLLLRRKAKRLDRIKREEAILQMTNQVKEQQTAVFDSGATSHCVREEDNFIPTDEPSHKIFHLPTGQTTKAST